MSEGSPGQDGRRPAAAAIRTVPGMAAPDPAELKGVAYEIFVLLVSMLSVVNTAIVLLFHGTPIEQVALVVDSLVAPVFAFDFGYRLLTAPSPPSTVTLARSGEPSSHDATTAGTEVGLT